MWATLTVAQIPGVQDTPAAPSGRGQVSITWHFCPFWWQVHPAHREGRAAHSRDWMTRSSTRITWAGFPSPSQLRFPGPHLLSGQVREEPAVLCQGSVSWGLWGWEAGLKADFRCREGGTRYHHPAAGERPSQGFEARDLRTSGVSC